MTPPLPPASIRRCPARSRSFLLRPDGPAGGPPGQRLRSGALTRLRENRERNKIRITKSPRFEGNPAVAREKDSEQGGLHGEVSGSLLVNLGPKPPSEPRGHLSMHVALQ
jgi:hypothetical protein